jgi:hypothetical protein
MFSLTPINTMIFIPTPWTAMAARLHSQFGTKTMHEPNFQVRAYAARNDVVEAVVTVVITETSKGVCR